jgi:hypothetical protein
VSGVHGESETRLLWNFMGRILSFCLFGRSRFSSVGIAITVRALVRACVCSTVGGRSSGCNAKTAQSVLFAD